MASGIDVEAVQNDLGRLEGAHLRIYPISSCYSSVSIAIAPADLLPDGYLRTS